ncbi:MAG TPA: serine/threonine protein kinase [Polyangiaceae bacterium]|nr:serine/threonine protein kinase [Polyangiaceae bacterium]
MAEDLFGIVGTVIASAYHVESVVAEGGFGIVYRARHGGFRAPVALKCLKVPQHLGAEYQARFLEQFRAEAEVMFRLSASTATVTRPLHVDVMTAPNGSFVPFMVLEWLDGDTLDALIRSRVAAGKRPLTLAEVLPLFEPVAKALERAHHFEGPAGAESIAHCDLKPENIFIANVGGERVPKILDFGVAQVRGAASRGSKAGDEVTLFTPAYGAPEQWNPKELGETGPWTDVWGLALTLVETLAGKPVIVGGHAAVRAQVLDRARRPTPRAQGLVVGDGVEAAFHRALAVDPRDRYRDAGAFWRALVEASERASAAAPSGQLIPDLVPLARKPSRPELPAVQGPVSFDFEEGEEAPGAKLDLDLPLDEPIPRRSLTPPSLHPSLPAVPLGDTQLAAPPPNARGSLPPVQAMPSLAPVSSQPRPRIESPAPEPPRAGSNPPSGRRSDSGAPRRADAVFVSTPVPAERSLARRLAPGLALAGTSIVLTLLDRLYASLSGEVFSLGPLRTSWVAAALLIGGFGLCAREVFSPD